MKSKGISLIVLVITIIVMLIVGGAIILTLSESNIFEQAGVAKEKHLKQIINEQLNLAQTNVNLASLNNVGKEACYENKNNFITYGKLDTTVFEIEGYIFQRNLQQAVFGIKQKDSDKVYYYSINYATGKVTELESLDLTRRNITYLLNDGTNGESAPATYRVGETVILPSPTKDGAIFGGWYVNENFTGEPITQITSEMEENIMIYAKWETPTNESYFTFTISGTNATITELSAEGLEVYNSGDLIELVLPCNYNYEGTSYTVNAINANAFNGKINIEKVVIPSSITTFGSGAFYNCGKTANEFKVILEKGRTTLFRNFMRDQQYLKSIIIPEGVTSIEGYENYGSFSGAFYNCKNLTNVSLPTTLTNIGTRAFYNCNKLTNLSIPVTSSPLEIGKMAFQSCSSLTEIAVPSTVITIGQQAFNNCSNVNSLTLPQTPINIAKEAFADCDKLASVTLPAQTNITGSNVFYGCGSIAGEFRVTIEPGRTELSKNFLQNTNFLKSVVIPQGVTIINGQENYGAYNGAFAGCDKLTSVTVPNSLTTIGDCAFSGCTSLTSPIIPSTIEKIGAYAYQNCTSITNVVIPTTIKQIGTRAFNNCSNINSLTLPQTPINIAKEAFTDCDKLASVILPAQTNITGSNVFYNCGSIAGEFRVTIEPGRTELSKNFLQNTNFLKSIVIPQGVTTINGQEYYGAYNGAFAGCNKLTSVTVPNSLTTIGDCAFRGCTSLTSPIIPSTIEKIGAYAYQNCTSITNVVIPTTIKQIGTRAFNGCTGITSVTLPQTTLAIKADVFNGCTNLESITIPATVTEIGSGCFVNCGGTAGEFRVTLSSGRTVLPNTFFQWANNIKTVTVPEGVTSIVGVNYYGAYSGAFYHCTGLTSVSLPASLTSIGTYAFCGATALTNIIFAGTTQEWTAVTKGDQWKKDVPATEVTCSNGTVAL